MNRYKIEKKKTWKSIKSQKGGTKLIKSQTIFWKVRREFLGKEREKREKRKKKNSFAT